METRCHITAIVETRDPLESLGSFVSSGSRYPRDPRDNWYPWDPGILVSSGSFVSLYPRYP